jgi:hypothetical protein
MTLFQQVAVWSLRALALWTAVELGAASFNTMTERAHSWVRLGGHQAAIERLGQRASALEAEAAAADARLAAVSANALRVQSPRPDAPASTQVAAMLREELMTLGAQAPVVDATETALSGPLRRLHLTLRWRENADNAPAILHALSARQGHLQIVSMTLARQDALVVVEVAASAMIRIDAAP